MSNFLDGRSVVEHSIKGESLGEQREGERLTHAQHSGGEREREVRGPSGS